MNTAPATPAKPSAVSSFVGEAAAAPEATVKVEITGTPPAVQRAISKMAAKKGLGKRPGAGGPGPGSGPEQKGPPARSPRGPVGAKDADDGDDDSSPEVKEKAVDVVEALIQEQPAPAKRDC